MKVTKKNFKTIRFVFVNSANLVKKCHLYILFLEIVKHIKENRRWRTIMTTCKMVTQDLNPQTIRSLPCRRTVSFHSIVQ
jgi:hypothetical protein